MIKSINFGGCDVNPDICFVFMNLTASNNASFSTWNGIQAPWIGTKTLLNKFIMR